MTDTPITIRSALASVAPEFRFVKRPPFANVAGYWETTFAQAVSLRNLVNRAAPAVPFGTLDYASSGIRIDTTEKVDLAADSAVFTRFIICRGVGVVSGTASTYFRPLGNVASGVGGCDMRVTFSGGSLQVGSLAYNGASIHHQITFPTTEAALNQYRVYGHRMAANGIARVVDYTGGLSQVGTGTPGAYTPYAPLVRANSLFATGGGTFDLVAAMLATSAYSDADMDAAGAWMAAQAPFLGITLGP